MARIEGVPKKQGQLDDAIRVLVGEAALGQEVPDSLTLVARHAWLSRGYSAFELALERSRLVDARLKALVSLKVALWSAVLFEGTSALPWARAPRLTGA
jgi:hypothetical protein